MKILFMFLLIVFIYTALILYVIFFKSLTYSDIDLNNNHIISITELLYSLDTKKRFVCITEDGQKMEYSQLKKINRNICSSIILEVYSLKDGLILKQVKIK